MYITNTAMCSSKEIIMNLFRTTLIVAAITGITACGGGNTVESVESHSTISEIVDIDAKPAFHRMPVVLDAPVESGDSQPKEIRISSDLAKIDTSLLTEERLTVLQADAKKHSLGASSNANVPVAIYTPSQIRMAYGMAQIPTNLNNLSAADAAALGAGQTIYIITAYSAPNLLKDLQTFNSAFNLPNCKEVPIPVTTKIVNTLTYSGTAPIVGGPLLAAAPKDGCTISIVNTNVGPTLTATPPAYNSTWALETSLDVQWAHATAPLARIVVLQSLNSFVNSLADSITVANQFGPGVVSMSIVGSESSIYTEKYEYFFKGTGMTYVAAAGDMGTEANWPATSPSVIAVGGTTLNSYTKTGGRNEVVWAKSGGGYSQYFPAPTYQTALPVTTAVTGKYSTKPGVRPRATTDVSFNADPYTGHYMIYTPYGSTSPLWYSMGGTSAGTPQIAGIVAVANAQRALKGLPTMGKFNDKLYGYLSAGFSDIKVGNNGTCDVCTAKAGWDIPTGIGTPNVNNLLPLMNN